MEVILISLVAFCGSLLTFFSGFGLGTILTPVLILFFPIEIAIAMTGIVHFLNNIFKFGLTYKNTDWSIALKFSLTAIIFSAIGAWVLSNITSDIVVYSYHLFGKYFHVTLIKVTMAFLMIIFVIVEIHPRLKKMTFGKDKIYFGGALSGFFGGLAGFQGALRSMFLLKSGLSKEAFISTGIFIACMIDITRLSTYFTTFDTQFLILNFPMLAFTVVSAFTGAFLGNRWMNKITIDTVQTVVSVLLLIMAVLLATGIL